MDEQSLADQIRRLISQNKTEEAFELLSNAQFSKADKELIILNSQYNRIREELRLNVISKDEAERRINQINMALLDMSGKIGMKKQPAPLSGFSETNKKFNPLWGLLLLIPVAAFLLYQAFGSNGEVGTDTKNPDATESPITAGEDDKAEAPTETTEDGKAEATTKTTPVNELVKPPVRSEPAKPVVFEHPAQIAHYSFDNGSSLDAVGGNHIRKKVGVTIGKGWDGSANSAYYFNGKESRLELPLLLPQDSDNYAISFWVKCTRCTGSIFAQYTQEAKPYVGVNHQVQIAEGILYSDEYPSTGGGSFKSAQKVPNDEWTHVVFTREGNEGRMYLNGTLDNKGTVTEKYDPKWGKAHYTVVGVRPQKAGNASYGASVDMGVSGVTIYTVKSFNGWLDELRVFNAAIDAETVKKLYSAK